MKALVVFYSRTGITRQVASAIAAGLEGELEEIIDQKNRAGPIGWLGAGKDASLGHLTEIGPMNRDPTAYDLVVLGTPVWAFTMAPAVRTYISQFKEKLKKVAFFCTLGGTGDVKTFAAMAQAAGLTPIATAAFREKDVKAGKCAQAMQEFVAKLG